MTFDANITDTRNMSPAELDRLTDHYVQTAKRLRSEAIVGLFSALFTGIFDRIKGVFSHSHTLAGRTPSHAKPA